MRKSFVADALSISVYLTGVKFHVLKEQKKNADAVNVNASLLL